MVHQVSAHHIAGVSGPRGQQQLGALYGVGGNHVDAALGGVGRVSMRIHVPIAFISDPGDAARFRVQLDFRSHGLIDDFHIVSVRDLIKGF